MKIVNTPQDWQALLGSDALAGKRIGLVPTMGALHPGHISLMSRARAECDIVVASIFLNPTQFNDASDLEHYPQPFDEDCRMAEEAGVDYVFAPDKELLYPDGYRYRVSETEFSKELCGAHRPGHFDGVLTVVLKLFQVVRPQRAYFGEKDFQQLTLIEGMVKAFFLDIEIVPCPIVREEDGLAMSSRNRRLSSEGRALAPCFHEILNTKHTTNEVHRQLEAEGFEVDYVIDREGRRYGAVVLEQVRLIDNVPIQNSL